MSKLFTKDLQVYCEPSQRVWSVLGQKIQDLNISGTPLRVILTSVGEDNQLTFECSFLETERQPVWQSLLKINPRQSNSSSPFVVVSIIPTGVRAEIGRFAGDGTPSTNLLAQACDRLIVNPNSVTASDLYLANDNILYLEGNLICHLLLGHNKVIPQTRNKIGVIIEKTEDKFLNVILNAINMDKKL